MSFTAIFGVRDQYGRFIPLSPWISTSTAGVDSDTREGFTPAERSFTSQTFISTIQLGTRFDAVAWQNFAFAQLPFPNQPTEDFTFDFETFPVYAPPSESSSISATSNLEDEIKISIDVNYAKSVMDRFSIERATNSNGPFSTIATFSHPIDIYNTIVYSDTSGLNSSDTYYYRIKQQNIKGSSYSATVSGKALITSKTLTTSVLSGDGSLRSPLCSSATRGTQECSGIILSGTSVDIIATPDSFNSVLSWNSSPSITLDTSVENIASFIMPSSDIEVTVTFVHNEMSLITDVGIGTGLINLLVPSGRTVPSSGEIISISPTESPTVVVGASPGPGWEVASWFIDGVNQSSTADSITFSVIDVTSKTVVVNFVEETPCIENTFTVNITGSGSVSPPSGNYCEDLTLTLNPIPSIGFRFASWDYDLNSGIIANGNNLLVPMNIDRAIGVTFEPKSIPIVESTSLSVLRASEAVSFYCPSETYKDNVVSFNFSNNNEIFNNPSDDNPSIDRSFHFRINFYADLEKTKLVYSAFSLSDNKRWFYNDGAFNQLSSDGIDVIFGETINIIYDPEILPQQITETHKIHLINEETIVYEKPLICGVKYYVEIEVYNLSTNIISTLETITLILDCDRVDSYYWNYNKDKNNWLCSGQGKMDLKVCGGFGQAIDSSIASNIFGIFQIVWQGRRSGSNNIYSAKWDSENDILYSSGQGLYDILELTSSHLPIILADQSSNFYVAGNLEDSIKYKACSLDVCQESVLGEISSGDATFEGFCFPGSASFLNSSYDEIKVRVYPEDIAGSLVISDEKVVPIVNKKSIRLDIDGIVGAYAVRLRNIEDPAWGEWINIDSSLEGIETGDNITYDAYRIDNSRFIVSWDVERNNGLRRICCQILTLYGISNTFCVDMLANFDVVQHTFKFYTDAARSIEFPSYQGKYVLSLTNGGTPDSDGGVTIYFEAIFNEKIYFDETSMTSYVDDDIKFNIIQQGVNDIRKFNLKITGDDKIFFGEFKIYNDDGIFNKDGTGFIELILPGSSVAESCGSDNSDIYNIVNTDLEEIANIDLIPEESFENYQKNLLSKALDVNKFKQFYDKDDSNFKFGNPDYFRD